MRSRGWMALGALVCCGCVATGPHPGPRADASKTAPAPEAIVPASSTRLVPAPPAPAAITTDPPGDIVRTPRVVEAPTLPVAPAILIPPPSKIEAEVPAAEAPKPAPVAATAPPLEKATPPAEAPATTPGPALPGPTAAALVLPPTPPVVTPAASTAIEPAPEVPTRPAPDRSKGGRPVAKVGDEVITLPELTEAVKARLAQLGPDAAPGRRQVIAIARSVLKAMIVESLVAQEASERLGGPARVDATRAKMGRAWTAEEWPATLRREGVANEADLRAKLAKSLNSPESLRAQYVVRALAGELMRLDGLDLDFDAYVDGLRGRRPITSIMSPAELAIAGRKAALSGEVDR